MELVELFLFIISWKKLIWKQNKWFSFPGFQLKKICLLIEKNKKNYYSCYTEKKGRIFDLHFTKKCLAHLL